jgi:NAD(P)-dependent dehydrogenase (short-subunit alcohol dehydrogenase family)
LTGQTILIIGSNQGIGFEYIRQLLIANASTVILAVRSTAKGKVARETLFSDPKIAALKIIPEIKVMEVDLAVYKSILAFVRM